MEHPEIEPVPIWIPVLQAEALATPYHSTTPSTHFIKLMFYLNNKIKDEYNTKREQGNKSISLMNISTKILNEILVSSICDTWKVCAITKHCFNISK